MGMNDKQFDAYNENLRNQLRRAIKELDARGMKNEILDEVLETLENLLKRP